MYAGSLTRLIIDAWRTSLSGASGLALNRRDRLVRRSHVVSDARRWSAWIVSALCIAWFLPQASSAEDEFGLLGEAIRQPWRRTEFRELEGAGLRCVAVGEKVVWFGLADGVIRYDGLNWKRFGSSDGLPESLTRKILICRDGNVLVANTTGIFQFHDDSSWSRVYPFKSLDTEFPVLDVIEDSDGRIWAATTWGLCEIDFNARESHIYTSPTFASDVETFVDVTSVNIIPEELLLRKEWPNGTGIVLLRQRVMEMSEDSPARKAGLQLGDQVLKVNGEVFRLVRNLRASPGRQIELLVKRPGVDENIRIAFEAQQIEGDFGHSMMQTLAEDHDGNIWVATTGGRLLRLSKQDKDWRNWPDDNGPSQGSRPSLLVADDGAVWFVTRRRNSHVSRFDGENWQHFDLEDFDGNNANTSIAQTSDGVIWVGGPSLIHEFSGDSWKVHPASSIRSPSDRIQLLATAGGALWVYGIEQHAVRYAIATTASFEVEQLAYACTDSQHSEWFVDSDNHSVVRISIDEREEFDVTDGLIDTPLHAVASTNARVIVIGSHEGIAACSEYDGKNWTRQQFPNMGPSFLAEGSTVTSQGYFWGAVEADPALNLPGGLIVQDAFGWQRFYGSDAPRGITSIVEIDDNRVLLATNQGALIFAGSSFHHVDHKRLAKANCTVANKGPDGNIWVGTRADGLFGYANGVWEQFDQGEGLPTNEILDIASPSSGSLWLSTKDGILWFDGKQFINLGVFGVLAGCSLDDGRHGSLWLAKRLRYTPDQQPPETYFDSSVLEFPYGERGTATWRAVDQWNQTTQADLTFSWRLNDGAWSHFHHARSIELSNLDVGAHTLEVRARDIDGNIDPQSAKLQIRVLPPFWRQTWFLASVLSVTVALVWQGVRLLQRSIALRRTNEQLGAARTQLAELLAAKSAQFETICNRSPTGIFVADFGGKITYINPHLEHLTGLSYDEALGDGWAQAIHPEDRERIHTYWAGRRSNTRTNPTEGRFVRADGSCVRFVVRIDSFEDAGESVGYVGIVEDVTDQRKTEEMQRLQLSSLIQLDERVRQLLRVITNRSDFYQMVVQGISELTRADLSALPLREDKNDEFQNVAACGDGEHSLLGNRFPLNDSDLYRWVVENRKSLLSQDLSSDSRITHPPYDHLEVRSAIVVPLVIDDEVIGALAAYRKHEPFTEFDLRVLNLFSQSVCVAHRNLDVMSDLEDRVNVRTRKLAQANSDLESYAHSVAHDLRAPLRAMHGFAQALREDYESKLDAPGRTYIDFIETAAQQMDQLIQDLLEYSKIGRSEMSSEEIDLDVVVQHSIEQLEAELVEQHAELRIASPLGTAVGHRSTLVQIVSNLISNSAKFVADGTNPVIEIKSHCSNGAVRLTVADNGIGIAPEHQERIFRVFERLHGAETYPGTGIGLAIVRRGVESLGGRFGVESDRQDGSQFWIELERRA